MEIKKKLLLSVALAVGYVGLTSAQSEFDDLYFKRSDRKVNVGKAPKLPQKLDRVEVESPTVQNMPIAATATGSKFANPEYNGLLDTSLPESGQMAYYDANAAVEEELLYREGMRPDYASFNQRQRSQNLGWQNNAFHNNAFGNPFWNRGFVGNGFYDPFFMRNRFMFGGPMVSFGWTAFRPFTAVNVGFGFGYDPFFDPFYDPFLDPFCFGPTVARGWGWRNSFWGWPNRNVVVINNNNTIVDNGRIINNRRVVGPRYNRGYVRGSNNGRYASSNNRVTRYPSRLGTNGRSSGYSTNGRTYGGRSGSYNTGRSSSGRSSGYNRSGSSSGRSSGYNRSSGSSGRSSGYNRSGGSSGRSGSYNRSGGGSSGRSGGYNRSGGGSRGGRG